MQTKLRPGLIYRSGELSKMTQRGTSDFVKLNTTKIFDFRSPIEISSPSVHGADDNLHHNGSAAAYEQLLKEGLARRESGGASFS
jgi:hypothetical protein